MLSNLEILKNYWGHSSFRPGQEDIIDSILSGKDTLALLPTGGGKSICYQVPGLQNDGVCLVISPLIALMEDQVKQLTDRKIKAIAINSSLSKKQLDIALDNAIYGNTKFLYVSPERLKSKLFLTRFQKMNVNLIAIDEAHCISQWGYDFRPSYLEIGEIRKLKPEVPLLALTATATPTVVTDIQEKLNFKSTNVIQNSFVRENLTYSTIYSENKLNKITQLLLHHQGTGIIYCSTRRKVKELYQQLKENGHSVDYYHAGLDYEIRKDKQIKWFENKTRIMISTNAFGMGIDKSDVRFVAHYDPPQSIEAYFQEAGRAGRDEKTALTYLLYDDLDVERLKNATELKFPPIATIKSIYNALGNHFQLAIGSGLNESYPIDLSAFSEKYNFSLILVYNSLKFLELCGFIQLSEQYKKPSTIKILGNKTDLYNYQVKDETLNKIIQFILRTEMMVYDDYVRLDEYKLSKATGLSISVIHDKLNFLSRQEIVDFIPRSELPQLTYLTERLNENNLSISPKFYQDRKSVAETQIQSVLKFLDTEECKNIFLLKYFGENSNITCGKCNSCKAKNKQLSRNENRNLQRAVLKSISIKESIPIVELLAEFIEYPEKEIFEILRHLAEYNEIFVDELGRNVRINR